MAGGLVTIAQYRDLPEAGLAKSQLYFVALRGRGAKGTVVTLLSYREKKVNQGGGGHNTNKFVTHVYSGDTIPIN